MSILPVILAATALAAAPRRIPGERTAAPLPPVATWEELCARPTAWLGKPVRLHVQTSSRVESWNPYLTRFSSSRYVAVQAWADEQFPWVRADFEAPSVRLFVRRGSACEWAFDGTDASTRCEVSGVVRELFLDLPWIEVVEVLPLAERIGEGTVIHAAKARELLEAGSFGLAALELDQAITDSLPARARAELDRMRAYCREAVQAERGSRGSDPVRR